MPVLSASLLFAVCFLDASAFAQEWKSGVDWDEPPAVTPGSQNHLPPSDAIVLFDGTSLEQWNGGEHWQIEDGAAIPRQADIVSKQHFGDIQLHVEWSAPTEIRGAGQGRGNSGIFLMGLYEVQILDSWENTTYFDGQAGSIYKQTPPMANAMRPPGEWNAYDIIFTAPRFRVNGDVERPGYVTVIHNGIVVLNHFELLGPTSYVDAPHYAAHGETGPLRLQFHGDAVRFRNIWVRDLQPPTGVRVRAPFNIRPPVQPPAAEEPADEEPAEDKPAATVDATGDEQPSADKPEQSQPDAGTAGRR